MYAFAYYILQQPSFIKDKTGGSNNLRATEWRREKHSAETAMADGGALRWYSDTVVVVERKGGIQICLLLVVVMVEEAMRIKYACWWWWSWLKKL